MHLLSINPLKRFSRIFVIMEIINFHENVMDQLQVRCVELQATIAREMKISKIFKTEKLKLEAKMVAINDQIVEIYDQNPEVYGEEIDEKIDDLRFSFSCVRKQRLDVADYAAYAGYLFMKATKELKATQLSILLLSRSIRQLVE
jgi:hypothetical protein